MMRFFFYSVALVAAVYSHAAESPDRLAVYVGPSFVPDSGISNLFSNRLARVDFLFYRTGDAPVENLAKNVFTVDLPKECDLSVALMTGWKTSGGKFRNLPAEPVTRDGREFMRYTVPLPQHQPMMKAEAVEGGNFGGICYNIAKLFLRFQEGAPPSFTAYWKISGPTANLEGSFPVQLFDFPSAAIPQPRRIPVIDTFATFTPLYADTDQIRDIASQLRALGVTHVPILNRMALLKKGEPDLWSELGFQFLATEFEPMDFGLERNTLPAGEDYVVGLDGQRAKGSHPDKFHGRIYCPLSLSTPGRAGFEKIKERALEKFAAGADWVDFDLEPPIFNECFCGECLREFQSFSRLPANKLSRMKSLDIILTYPETWYRFRSTQTTRLYKNLREAIREKFPKARISANSLLVNLEKEFGEIGRGGCDFSEDPRMTDAEVDLHTVDALTGSVHDAIIMDVMREQTTKPLIGTAGSSYCVAYNHANIVGRRIQAEQRNRPLGYNRRGDFQRLGMVHSVASGARGVRVSILEEEETIDAEVALKTADGVSTLAKLEDVYLDGKRCDDEVEVIDLTPGKDPYAEDSSLIAGGVWKHFYDLYGPVQYRAHRLNRETVVSLFNWNPHQDKQWLVRFKKAPEGAIGVSDKLIGVQFSLGTKPWSQEELEKGILITVPSVGFTILSFGTPVEGNPVKLIAGNVREEYLSQAVGRSPANQNAWRTNEKVNFRKMALDKIQRGSQYLLPGTIPERFLVK